MAGIAAKHDDAVSQQHRLFDVMGDQEDGLGGHGLVGPQLQKFTAQVFRGQHIEGAERLVHEKDFRFDHQGAGKAHPLLHAPDNSLG